jgi:hypothetical protein
MWYKIKVNLNIMLLVIAAALLTVVQFIVMGALSASLAKHGFLQEIHKLKLHLASLRTWL